MLKLDWLARSESANKHCCATNPIGELIRIIARNDDINIFGTDFVKAIDKHILKHYFNKIIVVGLVYTIYFLSVVNYLSFYRDATYSEDDNIQTRE